MIQEKKEIKTVMDIKETKKLKYKNTIFYGMLGTVIFALAVDNLPGLKEVNGLITALFGITVLLLIAKDYSDVVYKHNLLAIKHDYLKRINKLHQGMIAEMLKTKLQNKTTNPQKK